jgi:hypothetical protein
VITTSHTQTRRAAAFRVPQPGDRQVARAPGFLQASARAWFARDPAVHAPD